MCRACAGWWDLWLGPSCLQTSALLGSRELGSFPLRAAAGLSCLFLVNSPERKAAGEQLELDKGKVISADVLKYAKELCISGGLCSGCCGFFSASH